MTITEEYWTTDGTAVRKLSSAYISITKPLLGPLAISTSQVREIIKDLLPFLEDESRDTLEIASVNDSSPLIVNAFSQNESWIYRVTFFCSDEWWFSDESLREILSCLEKILEDK